MAPDTEPAPRNRLVAIAAGVLVTATGLVWRSGHLPLSPFLTKYGGDALWALLVFIGCGFLLPRAFTLKIAVMSLGFACSIEFLQLYHAPWIDSLRATLPGRLVLGSTFNPPDLIAHAAGVVAGTFCEAFCRSGSQRD